MPSNQERPPDDLAVLIDTMEWPNSHKRIVIRSDQLHSYVYMDHKYYPGETLSESLRNALLAAHGFEDKGVKP